MADRIVIAGGSGFLGRSLTAFCLTKGYDVVILTRSPSQNSGAVRFAQWDGRTVDDWSRCLAGAKAIVNLAGKNVNCRHTPENRRQIIESRVDSVRVLGDAIQQCAQPPAAFVQAGAVGIYGNAGDRWCDENSPTGDDFLAQVCREWEAAFAEIKAPNVRKTLLRIGLPLSRHGGILDLLGKLTRWFLGGHIGNGRQYMSWIHHVDLMQMFLGAIERNNISGVFNATSPNPVTNAEFMRELRRAFDRPWSPPVPEWAAHVGSWLMRTEANLALSGQRCTPKHLLEKNIRFEFPELHTALAGICQANPSHPGSTANV